MSKLFIVCRTDYIDGKATAIRKTIQNARARGASVGPVALPAFASTVMTPSTTTGAFA